MRRACGSASSDAREHSIEIFADVFGKEAIGIFLGFVVSAILATYAYSREQKSKRTELKHGLYSNLQHSIFTIWAAKGDTKKEIEALRIISDAWIFASDPVLKQVNEEDMIKELLKKGELFEIRPGRLNVLE